MLIRDATVNDYEQINNLNLRHNLNLPDKKEWGKIWLNNPEFIFKNDPIGWVIEDQKKIRGFLGFIKKKYSDHKGAELNSLIISDWVVDKDYRSLSLSLLSNFFNKKNYDLFINSTANLKASKVWEAFGAKKIPLNNIQSSLFIPINCRKVSNKIFRNIFLNFILYNFLKYFLKFRILSIKENSKYEIEYVKCYDNEIKNFDKSQKKKEHVQENLDYNWYISILEKKNKINFLKIFKENSLIAYCVLLSSKNKNFNKTYLAQIKIKDKYLNDNSIYEFIIKKIFIYSKYINTDLIEIKYIDENIFNFLKKIIMINKSKKYCSFYFYSKDKDLILKLSKEKWLINMFSGDSFLI